jgi:hypothetical protein
MTLGAVVLALIAASVTCAQLPVGSRAQVMISSGGMASMQTLEGVRGEVMREIDDPHTGDRWLLVRDDQYPGGPGRMVLVSAQRLGAGGAFRRAVEPSGEAGTPPVIRAGDRLIVEEHTPVVDAVLAARALTSASVGAALDVRLTMGGRVVRAVAQAPGRAVIEAGTGVRP